VPWRACDVFVVKPTQRNYGHWGGSFLI
jgi:hypothetical protein